MSLNCVKYAAILHTNHTKGVIHVQMFNEPQRIIKEGLIGSAERTSVCVCGNREAMLYIIGNPAHAHEIILSVMMKIKSINPYTFLSDFEKVFFFAPFSMLSLCGIDEDEPLLKMRN